MKDKVILVTGANRGVGRALAAEALARGAKRVYAGTRHPLADPVDRLTETTLDVTSATQIQAAAGQVESLERQFARVAPAGSSGERASVPSDSESHRRA